MTDLEIIELALRQLADQYLLRPEAADTGHVLHELADELVAEAAKQGRPSSLRKDPQ